MPKEKETAAPAPTPPAIRLRGVRTHNLQAVDAAFPHRRLTAVTGVSGSGKSSLAFDTLFAECQLRFLESLSPYLRQFMDKFPKPALAAAEGLLPAMALRQRRAVKNSRSTVGTLTDLADHLRLLMVKAGARHCPQCDGRIAVYSAAAIAAWCAEALAGAAVTVLFRFPAPAGRGGPAVRELIQRMGFARVLSGDRFVRTEEWAGGEPPLVVVDRITAADGERDRLLEAARTALAEGGDECLLALPAAAAPAAWPPNVAVEPAGELLLVSFPGRSRCAGCGAELPPLTESLLSSNNPAGACPACKGFGDVLHYDPARYLDPARTLAENPVVVWQSRSFRPYHRYLLTVAERRGWPLHVPFRDLAPEIRDAVVRGDRGYAGVDGFFRRLEKKSYRLHIRVLLARYRRYGRCPDCGGKRLNPAALSVRLAGRDLGEILGLTVDEALRFLRLAAVPPDVLPAVRRVLDEIADRLECLRQMGLGYLALDRPAFTLSGGEAQRVHLAAVLGTRLADTLFVLDEPTMGLHPRDHGRLAGILRRLCAEGNTVVFVEHDPAFIACADHVVELGPDAGQFGGRVVYQGAMESFRANADTATAAVLRARGDGRVRAAGPRPAHWLELEGASARNLKGLRLRLPLGRLSVVSGVSGSGKSTLLEEALLAGVAAVLAGQPLPAGLAALGGAEAFRSVRHVDQGLPPGSGRSNPATFLKIFDAVRTLFANLPEARLHGLAPGYFSLNTDGGRCALCRGRGATVLDMQFLADEEILCEACDGTGFSAEAREYRYRDLDIVGVLDLTVDQALDFFSEGAPPAMRRKLEFLAGLGLGYLRLGQPLSTLSGGEMQRLKLGRVLLEPGAGPELILLDEPTIGLHPRDTRKLFAVLDRLLEQGHTVVAVEHDLFFIENADWVVDLGPEGGDRGGYLLYQGPPEGLADCPESLTGRELARWRGRE